MTVTPTAHILVWSDYVCPFCYLELPVLDQLRDRYDGRISIEWKAFELRPEPEPTLDPDGGYLHRVWNQSAYPLAERRNMTLRLPPVQPRSRKAFEAAAFARTQGRFDAMHHALFRGFFEDGFDIGNERVLLDLGQSAGIDANALAEAFQEGRFTQQVVAEQQAARSMGLNGVPAMVIVPDGNIGRRPLLVSGAQPYEVVAGAVEQILTGKPS